MNSHEIYRIPDGTEIIHVSDLKDHICETIEIPASVKKIEEGSFAYGKKPMRILFSGNSYYSFQNHFLIEKQTHKLIAYTGDSSIIHVPAELSSISQWAFWECTADQIIFPDKIEEIHENALTTSQIKVAVFSFCHAHIYFPQKDIRLRQYLLEGFGRNGMFDFSRYDEGIYTGYIEPDRIREMTARLKWPYRLSAETAEDFRMILQNHLTEAVRQLGMVRDTDTIRWLCDLSLIHQDNQGEVLRTLHSLTDLHAYMDLSRYLNQNSSKQSFDFSI